MEIIINRGSKVLWGMDPRLVPEDAWTMAHSMAREWVTGSQSDATIHQANSDRLFVDMRIEPQCCDEAAYYYS